jgi:hypothetical protein
MISSRRATLTRQAQVERAVLLPAALVVGTDGGRVQVSLPREAGVVELARAIAEEVGVTVTAEIVADEIALTFSAAP